MESISPVQKTNKTGIHPNGQGNVPSKIGVSYVEPETNKPTEAPVYHPGPRPIPKLRWSQMTAKSSMAEVDEHSLQVSINELRKILEPKISELKGRYSTNPTLISNSWFKDIDMCVHGQI